VGGITVAFGTPIVASHDGSTNYRLAKFSGYDTASFWKSLQFDLTTSSRKSRIDELHFTFEPMSTNARVDWTLRNNAGTALFSGIISNTLDGSADFKQVFCKKNATNFRLELDWANGNTSNNVAIKSVRIYGSTIR
jgi:hypothetical protein